MGILNDMDAYDIELNWTSHKSFLQHNQVHEILDIWQSYGL